MDDLLFPSKPMTPGRRSQSEGKEAERYVDDACKRYADEKRALIISATARFHARARGAGGMASGWMTKGPVDRIGTVMTPSGARPIAFDVKSTSKAVFELKAITPHQIAQLRSWVEQGGIGFFLVRFRQEEGSGSWFILSIPIIASITQAQAGRRKVASLPLAWFKANAPHVPLLGRSRAPDFLAAVLERMVTAW